MILNQKYIWIFLLNLEEIPKFKAGNQVQMSKCKKYLLKG